jgi:hypothetical protein
MECEREYGGQNQPGYKQKSSVNFEFQYSLLTLDTDFVDLSDKNSNPFVEDNRKLYCLTMTFHRI